LDLRDSEIRLPNISVNQGNVDSVVFRFRVFDGSRELDYGRFSAVRAAFSYKNNAVAACDCQIKDDGIVCVPPPEAFARYGTVTGQLDMAFEPDGNLATNYFNFAVTPTLARFSSDSRRFYYDEIEGLRKLLADRVAAAANGTKAVDAAVEGVDARIAELEEVFEAFGLETEEMEKITTELNSVIQNAKEILETTESDGGKLKVMLEAAENGLKRLDAAVESAISEAQEKLDLLEGKVLEGNEHVAQINTIYLEGLEIKENFEALQKSLDTEQFVTQTVMRQFVAEALEGTEPEKSGFQSFQTNMASIYHGWRIFPDAPIPMNGAAVGLHDGKAYIFGCGTLNAQNILLIFDLETHELSVGPPTPTNCGNCSVICDEDKFYIFGGGESAAQRTIRIFDTVSGTYSAGADAPSGWDMSNTVSVLLNGRIYVMGGLVMQRNIRIYDIENDSWSMSSESPVIMGRASQTAFVYNGLIYFIGADTAADTVLTYAPAENTWNRLGRALMTVSARAAFNIAPGKYFINGAGTAPSRTSMIYRADTDKWEFGRIMPAPGAVATTRGVLYNNRIFYFGTVHGSTGSITCFTPPPPRFRMMRCKAGARFYADHPLITDYGQKLSAFTENIIEQDGYIEYNTSMYAETVSGWIEL